MESDTKNKRGRPSQHSTVYELFPEKGKRTAANLYFAMLFIRDVMGEIPGEKDNFFITERGNVRRQGIAEQLGRMIEADLVTPDQARELAQQAINEYNRGTSVKEITKILTTIRLNLQREDISLQAGDNPGK